jgi:hypothetical protein
MKATYLYNFAVYTEWPAEIGNEIQLCIMGEDRFHEALHAIHGKNVNSRRLMVRHLALSEDVNGCQMLYLGENDAKYSKKILDRISGQPVLTITEGSALMYSGIMISLTLEDRRLAFRVNASEARRAKLNISSKLLRLASNVY